MLLIIEEDDLIPVVHEIDIDARVAELLLKEIIANAPRAVDVLIITHKHGQDVYIGSEGHLQKSLAEYCQTWWEGERKKVGSCDWLPQEIPDDDDQAVQTYFCMARNESWEIHRLIEIG